MRDALLPVLVLVLMLGMCQHGICRPDASVVRLRCRRWGAPASSQGERVWYGLLIFGRDLLC